MQHKIRWSQLTADVSSTHELQIQQRLEEIPLLLSRLSVGVEQQQEGNKMYNSEEAGSQMQLVSAVLKPPLKINLPLLQHLEV